MKNSTKEKPAIKRKLPKIQTQRGPKDHKDANQAKEADDKTREKDNNAVIPQNFNSFRHVIGKATTADDVNWILKLRDTRTKPGRPQPTSITPFSFGDTMTKWFTNKKDILGYKIEGGDSQYVDHLLRKRKGPDRGNFSNGYFETGLRSYSNQNSRLRDLEKKFSPIAYFAKRDEFPKFLIKSKTLKTIKQELKQKEKELSVTKLRSDKIKLLRGLPRTEYSAFDSRAENMKYEQLEEKSRSKKNINETYHILKESHLPTVAFESYLREDKRFDKKRNAVTAGSPAPKK